MNQLEQAIIKTICFFDVFDYPLTSTEVWKWLYKPGQAYSLFEVRQALAHSQLLSKEIGVQEGFYSLKGREHIYKKRKHNNTLAEKKFEHALRVVKILSYVPFIRMIAICNNLAYGNAGDSSDIDFFIIAKSGRIWLARFFAIVLVRIFARRPKPGLHSNAICLSFFIDERQLNIRHIILGGNDIYTPYWVQQLLPVYNPDGLYEKFMSANDWYKSYLPNGYENDFVNLQRPTLASRWVGSILGWLAAPPFIRRLATVFYRRMQIKIIDRNLSSLVNVDTRVIVNEFMLKFHDVDRREEYFKAWRDRVINILGDYEKTKTATV